MTGHLTGFGILTGLGNLTGQADHGGPVCKSNSFNKFISLRSYFTLRFLLTGGTGLSWSHAEHLAASSSFLSVQYAQIQPLDLFLVLRIRSSVLFEWLLVTELVLWRIEGAKRTCPSS